VRILIAGDWHSELHEEAVYGAFRELGHEVSRFAWHAYFQPASDSMPLTRTISKLMCRVQNKYVAGPRVARLNRDFLDALDVASPALVFVYRGTHITRATLIDARRRLPGAVFLGYNNDDPFAPGHPYWLWRHFLAAVPVYDAVLAYRRHNLDDFRRAGAQRVELLRSWYVPERNHPVTLSDADAERYGCDVVFVGHYESDGRREHLEAVVQAGFALRIFGPGYDWDPAIGDSPWLAGQRPVRLVWGEDYNRALCGGKVALCFLSKLNRDTYTRRCFEIPATGTLMLSEYTDDLATLFRPGEEADYFRTPDEMVEKIAMYLGDEARRARVAAAGRRRVEMDGHDVVSRMRQVIGWANDIVAGRRNA